MVTFEIFKLPSRSRVERKRVGHEVLPGNQHVVADHLEGRPIVLLVIPDPEFVEAKKALHHGRVEFRRCALHPLDDAARVVRCPTGRLVRIEPADDDLLHRVAHFRPGVSRRLDVLLRLAGEFRLVSIRVVPDEALELVGRDVGRVNERFHVLVEMRPVFLKHAHKFRLHQDRLEPARPPNQLRERLALDQGPQNCLGNLRVEMRPADVLGEI